MWYEWNQTQWPPMGGVKRRNWGEMWDANMGLVGYSVWVTDLCWRRERKMRDVREKYIHTSRSHPPSASVPDSVGAWLVPLGFREIPLGQSLNIFGPSEVLAVKSGLSPSSYQCWHHGNTTMRLKCGRVIKLHRTRSTRKKCIFREQPFNRLVWEMQLSELLYVWVLTRMVE